MLASTIGFSDQNTTVFLSEEFIPIENTDKQHILSGEFKSIRGEQKSKLYFGVACYDKDKLFIQSHEAFRRGEPLLVTSVNETTITSSTPFEGKNWNDATVIGHARAIGFHFDGNTKNRPDIVLYHGEGVYSTWEGNTLKLTSNCWNTYKLENVTPRLTSSTVIMNYYSSSSYNYLAAYNQPKTTDWKVHSGIIQNEGFNSFNNFRPGTKYVKVIILPNQSPEDKNPPPDETAFRNIKFSVMLFSQF